MNAKDILEFVLENLMVHPLQQEMAALIVAAMSRQMSGLMHPLSRTFQKLFGTSEGKLARIQQSGDYLRVQMQNQSFEAQEQQLRQMQSSKIQAKPETVVLRQNQNLTNTLSHPTLTVSKSLFEEVDPKILVASTVESQNYLSRSSVLG